MRIGRPRSPHLIPLLCILLAVVIANFPALVHLVTTNPLVLNAGVTPLTHGRLPGLPYIDPNAGYTTQSLGHLAALDWLHGHVPWWNPFEGIGAPLAGEMQSGAFFPTTLLLALSQGTFYVQLILELTAGWSTYFLVRRLGVGRSMAAAAGVAFGLCGTFAWLAHAPIRPISLLPLCLIGVEQAVEAARERRPGGWILLAVALALSVLAGFPETTFIDGLFVALWAILRIVGPDRGCWRTESAKLITGAVVGLCLSAPLLVAFADYLPYAYLAGHGGALAETVARPQDIVQLVLPYSLGPITAFHSATGSNYFLDGTPGFLSVTLIAAGLVGLIGKRQRMLRLGLGGWVLVCLLRTFGFPPVLHAMAVIPGVRSTAFFLWSDPSWELAVVVLAALGLDDVARSLTRRRVLLLGTFVAALMAALAAVTAWTVMSTALGPSGGPGPYRTLYPSVSVTFAGAALALLAIGGVMGGRRPTEDGPDRERALRRADRARRRGRMLMAGVVSAESVLLLGFTYLSAPPETALQSGSVGWLQAHLGPYRFFTLGPIQPNYGSYFGIAEVNVNDLPMPSAWKDYIAAHLDSNAVPGNFTSTAEIIPTGPTPAQELTANLSNYEAVGVRYVVENADGRDTEGVAFPAPGSRPWPYGPRLVYHDARAEIWQLPYFPQPVFSLTRGDGSAPVALSCSVAGHGWYLATVRCSHPSVLLRREQYLPGWTATINGATVAVHEDRNGPPGLFQAVPVPAGTSTVRFTYLPPHETLALSAAAVALLVLLGSLVARVVRRGRSTRRQLEQRDTVLAQWERQLR